MSLHVMCVEMPYKVLSVGLGSKQQSVSLLGGVDLEM